MEVVDTRRGNEKGREGEPGRAGEGWKFSVGVIEGEGKGRQVKGNRRGREWREGKRRESEGYNGNQEGRGGGYSES